MGTDKLRRHALDQGRLIIVSTLLMIALVAMWIRTGFGSTILRHTTTAGSQRVIRRVILHGGRLSYRHTVSPNPRFAPPLGWALIHEGQFPEELWADDGIVGSRSETIPSTPLWLPVLLFSFAPAYWISYRKTFTKGHCPKCGYDVRATRTAAHNAARSSGQRKSILKARC